MNKALVAAMGLLAVITLSGNSCDQQTDTGTTTTVPEQPAPPADNPPADTDSK